MTAPDLLSPEAVDPRSAYVRDEGATGTYFVPAFGTSGLRMTGFDGTSTLLAVLATLSDGVMLVDRQWRLSYMNPAACRVFVENGTDPVKMIGRHFWDELFPGARGSEAAHQWLRAMNERVPVTFENYRASWRRRYELRLYPTPDGGVANVFRDITETRQAESVLRQQDAELQKADRRKDEFLATLAHELRNPLAPLRHGLQIMKLARGNAEIVEQARGMMERQVAYMVALVDDLLDLSRISRGEISMNRERIDLATAVSSALDTCEPGIRAAHQELDVSIPPEPIWVRGDPVRLAQVLNNLLNNASKYTNAGGRISMTVEVHGSEARIGVADTGIGIPAHMLSRVFDMFTQASGSTERGQKGLGIGLTVVKRLVEMHGGTVEARSEGADMGSEFIVRLPMASPSPGPALPEATSRAAPPVRRRILVVDDNPDAALGLATMLRLMGNEAEIAHGGQEALDIGAVFRPDVVLMDIGMPGMSGYGAARVMRGTLWGRGARLVAVTGWGLEEDRSASAQAGFDEHLVKPVESEAIARLLLSLGPPRLETLSGQA
jgi:signal transduction histidine kinase/CheY-like chemotaxis protein